MVNMGLLSGVAGMVFTAYLNAANPKDGTGFELDAIAAVVHRWRGRGRRRRHGHRGR